MPEGSPFKALRQGNKGKQRETTTANLTSTLTTSATKIQQRKPYVPAIHLSALLLCSILPSISIGSAFVFTSPMCSLVFQFLPVLSSMPRHVSTNGCLEGWQCSLLTSNIVPSRSPGPQLDASLFGTFQYVCVPLMKDLMPWGRQI